MRETKVEKIPTATLTRVGEPHRPRSQSYSATEPLISYRHRADAPKADGDHSNQAEGVTSIDHNHDTIVLVESLVPIDGVAFFSAERVRAIGIEPGKSVVVSSGNFLYHEDLATNGCMEVMVIGKPKEEIKDFATCEPAFLEK